MNLLREQFLRDLLGKQNIILTEEQDDAVHAFYNFVRSEASRNTYLLTGSAGTGKTFLINIFTKILRKQGYKVILLAPTGRAAKVITRRTQKAAYTIHHHIYTPLENAFGQLFFDLKVNKEQSKTAYIVDEASMIGDKAGESSQYGLLEDLLRFVFDSNEHRKLILVGDPVQLPPVNHSHSPALHPTELSLQYDLSVEHAHLREVKRQVLESEVLENAVLIRDAYQKQAKHLQLNPGREVMVMENSYEALETFLGYFEEGNPDRCVFLSYSNYQATRINQAIRHNLWHSEELLIPSDLLMVVRNNYAWGDKKRLPFIANGEMGTVREVYSDSYEERYGLKWMDAAIEFTDRKGETILIECKLILDLLTDKDAQIASEKMANIARERRQEYIGMTKNQARALLQSDPYIHALQVKYGYAITGHKAQGGQWENVIIGFEPDYGQNIAAYIRWTYTVFTRAEERVFLLNCPFVTD